MRTVTEIERAIEQLPPNEFIRLRDWISELEASRWDQQFENDVASGRLGALSNEALGDLKKGRCTDL